jgi:E3 ubiquitin-protein ligase HUWE1
LKTYLYILYQRACTDVFSNTMFLQPLGKGLLQRLLLNLCVHSVTRTYIVRLLLDMLKAGERESSGSEVSRLYGCRWNVVYSRSQVSDGM